MKKETWVTIGICCLILLAAGFVYLRSDAGGVVSGRETGQWEASLGENTGGAPFPESTDSRGAVSDTECMVYICGAVKHPGVYRFPGGARVCDAVEAAGGLTGRAAAEAVNQARLLADGEQIVIPRKEKKKRSGGGTVSVDSAGQREKNLVNLNEAGKEELMTLSGIGEAKAQSILDYRDENGRFSRTEDLMKISGIKEGIFQKIRDSITV